MLSHKDIRMNIDLSVDAIPNMGTDASMIAGHFISSI